MNRSLQTIACGVLCMAFFHGQAETVMEVLKSGGTMRHAVFPLYSQPDSKLSTIIHVDKAYLDHKRKGFFHIGILPVGALEGVTVEVRDTRSAADVFQQMQRWLGAGGDRVELRQVKILVSTNSLEAGLVQCRDGNRWELQDGVRMVSGGSETRGKRATLQVSGQEAGQVVLDGSAHVTNIFPGSPPGPNH
jgi:hypothetical protein